MQRFYLADINFYLIVYILQILCRSFKPVTSVCVSYTASGCQLIIPTVMSVYSRSFTSTLLQSSDLVSFLLPFLIFPSAPCLYCHFSLSCEPEVVQGQEEMTRVWQETAQGTDRAALFNFALLPVQQCSDTQTCTKTGSRFFSLWWPEAQIHILVNTYLNYLFGFFSFLKLHCCRQDWWTTHVSPTQTHT